VSTIVRYEARRRVRGAILITVGFILIAGLYVGLFPSFDESGVDFEQVFENLPEAAQGAFAIEAINTIEGFLAVELYQFIWILLFGIYMAYSGGSLVAADVEAGRLELLLAAPVSRTRIVYEKYCSLLVPVVVANLVVPLVIYLGVGFIGESLSLADLYAVHLLSVPYLLCCASIGLGLSVLFDRASIAQRGGIVAVFMLFLVETIASSTDFEWLGAVSPTRYYDPGEILVEGTYDVAGAAILLAGAVALLLASTVYFQRRDVG
jgi:ABC-2 type transport system permease protein